MTTDWKSFLRPVKGSSLNFALQGDCPQFWSGLRLGLGIALGFPFVTSNEEIRIRS